MGLPLPLTCHGARMCPGPQSYGAAARRRKLWPIFIEFHPAIPLPLDLRLLYSNTMTCRKLPSPPKPVKPSQMFSKWGTVAFFHEEAQYLGFCIRAQSLSLSVTTHNSTEIVSGLNYILHRAKAFEDLRICIDFVCNWVAKKKRDPTATSCKGKLTYLYNLCCAAENPL